MEKKPKNGWTNCNDLEYYPIGGRMKSIEADVAFLEDIRGRVEAWRRDTREKQSSLAERCGVGAAALANFLGGKKALPIYALANLAGVLAMEVERRIAGWEYSHCKTKPA